jgi:hypothetical protein
MRTRKPLHRRPLTLQPGDFLYVYEPGIGQTYQNGSYTILVGRESYAVSFQGKTLNYSLRDFLSAIEACARHEWVRRSQEGK